MEWKRVICPTAQLCDESESNSYQKSVGVPVKYWTIAEDNRLKKLVLRIGCDWERIAEFFPGKTPYELEKRYSHKLARNISSEEWTESEDEVLFSLVKRFGDNWTAISQHIPGRTPNRISQRARELQIDLSDTKMQIDSASEGVHESLEQLQLKLRDLEEYKLSCQEAINRLEKSMNM